MSGPRIFAQLKKVDEEKRLIYARAVQEVPDRADEVYDYTSSKPYFKAWSDEMFSASGGKSYGNVRAMHGKQAAGKIAEPLSFNDSEKAIDVVVKVVDDGDWKKTLEGIYTGLSIGGSYVGDKRTEKIDGRDVQRYTANPTEISLVDSPCVPTAKFFEVVKVDGSLAKVAFREPELQVTGSDEEVAAFAKLINDRNMTMADVIALVKGDYPGHPFHGNQYTSGESGRAQHNQASKAAHEATKNAHNKTTHLAAARAHAKAARLQDARGNHQTAMYHMMMSQYHRSEAAGTHKSIAADFQKIASSLWAIVGDEDEIAAKSVAYSDESIDDLVKREFSTDERKAAAKSGNALPDGSFPINTVSDLKNAISAYGRAKDKAAAKAHIIKRAKALGASDKIPDSWTADKAAGGKLKKSLYSVSDFASALCSLAQVARSAQYDFEIEGDDSPVPAKLRNCIDELIEVFQEMSEEESTEMLAELKSGAGIGADDEIENTIEAARKVGALRKRLADPELPFEELHKIANAHLSADEMKAFKSGDIAKITDAVIAKAARSASTDKAHLQEAHDHLAAMGAECAAPEKAAGGDLQKSADKLQKVEAALETALERIKKLEAQPAQHVLLRTMAVSREQDSARQRGEDVVKDGASITLADIKPENLVKNRDGSIDWELSRMNERMKRPA